MVDTDEDDGGMEPQDSKWKSLSCVWLFATPMDYAVHGILQARILGVGSLCLLQGIFSTQGLNPDLPAPLYFQ